MKTNMKSICLVLAASVVMGASSCGSTKKEVAPMGETIVGELPCDDCKTSTDEALRARAIRESMDQQMAKDMARNTALNELASNVNVSITSLMKDYAKRREINQNEELGRNTDQIINTWVDQIIQGYRTICEKYIFTTRPNGTKVYKCYLVVELNIENVAKSLYRKLSEDEKIHLDYDYEKFKSEFKEELNRHDKSR